MYQSLIYVSAKFRQFLQIYSKVVQQQPMCPEIMNTCVYLLSFEYEKVDM